MNLNRSAGLGLSLLLLSPPAQAAWQQGPYRVDWQAGLKIVRQQADGQQQLLFEGGPDWLNARRSRLAVQEQRGSFAITPHLQETCRQPVIHQAQTGARLRLRGGWAETGCGQGWELELAPTAEGHLRLNLQLQPGPLNQLGLRLRRGEDEKFYGGGESFSQVRLDGYTLPVWIQENGIGRGQQPVSALIDLFSPGSSGQAFSSYISVPWLLGHRAGSDRGLALENHAFSRWNLAAPGELTLEVWQSSLQLRLLGATQPGALLRSYTAWAGRMPLPPAWADRGAWLGMQGGTGRVRGVWQQLAQRRTPLAAFWLQDWVGRRPTRIGSQLWWNWERDRRLYAGWPALVRDLQGSGIRVLGYLNPFLVDVGDRPGSRRNLYAEARARGFLLQDAQGRPIQVQNTDFAAGMLDLSRPETRSWFKAVIAQQVLSEGFSGWMADYGEAVPLNARPASGEPAIRFHNRYAELWARLQREVVAQHPDLLVFLRAGYTRSPRWAQLFWEGDQTVSWDGDDGLASTVKGLLSSGLSGFSLNHSDAGGYTSICRAGMGLCRSPELLTRWLELNAWTAFLRSHEGNQPQEQAQVYSSPELLTAFDRNARIYAGWRFLRRQLFAEAAGSGWPVVRHLLLTYPNDPVAADIDDQFMLGPHLLVAPVLTAGASHRRVYLPTGPWVHLWSGRRYGFYTHGGWVNVAAPLGQIPVFYRAGSDLGPRLTAGLRAQGLRLPD